MPTISLDVLELAGSRDNAWDLRPFLVSSTTQVVRPARALNAYQLDRGQALFGYQFTVARTHLNYGAAGEYLDDLPRLVARTYGDFAVDRGLGGRGFRLVKAKITGFEPRPLIGIRTVVAFTVTGSLPPEIV